MFIALFLYLGTLIAVTTGLILGTTALERRKRSPALAVAGIMANCVLLLRVRG